MRLFAWLRPSNTVIHYTGHRILNDRSASRFPVHREREIQRLIRKILKRERVVAGFGALASGADILFAEALLRKGAEVHIVLATDPEAFLVASVAEAGQGWIRRFRRVLGAAQSVTILESAKGDAIDFAAGTDRALDLAEAYSHDVKRGRTLQIAVHDGQKDTELEGTGPDTLRALARGWDHIVIRVSREDKTRELLPQT